MTLVSDLDVSEHLLFRNEQFVSKVNSKQAKNAVFGHLVCEAQNCISILVQLTQVRSNPCHVVGNPLADKSLYLLPLVSYGYLFLNVEGVGKGYVDKRYDDEVAYIKGLPDGVVTIKQANFRGKQ